MKKLSILFIILLQSSVGFSQGVFGGIDKCRKNPQLCELQINVPKTPRGPRTGIYSTPALWSEQSMIEKREMLLSVLLDYAETNSISAASTKSAADILEDAFIFNEPITETDCGQLIELGFAEFCIQ